MKAAPCVLVASALERDEIPTEVSDTVIDSAGYRSIGQLIESFQKAGLTLEAFRAAEFEGDMEINPLYRTYIDPVDRDRAIADALERGKKAMQEYEDLKRQALDNQAKEFDSRVKSIAKALKEAENASSPIPPPRED